MALTITAVKKRIWKFILVLMAGQAVSLTVTGLGVFTTLLNDHTVLPYVAYKPGFVDKIKKHWWKFIFLGMADVYGTYLQTLAFKYTSVASNQAIANASITGFVAVISLFVMKTKFKMIHYASMLISCAGMVMVILEDFNSDSDGGNENPFLGDMICVCAGFSYAVLSVGQEFMIKGTLSVLEFMAMLSFSGAVITGIQLSILDRVKLVEMEWDLQSVLYFLGYHACDTLFYVAFPISIMISSAVVTSLSILTSIAYSVLFAVFFFGDKFSIFYIGGLVIILTGLVMYNVVVAPEGGADESVFSIGYWHNYWCSLCCEWRCCPPEDKAVELSDDIIVDDDPSINDNVDDDRLICSKMNDLVSGDVDDQSLTKDDQFVETHEFVTYDNVEQPVISVAEESL
ncbi:solute carrier family 35 member F2-like isoform X2 [Dysidea avara]|uniref:solute carrier family 35 member F2-like isoform X2 n=1 Tax=Dysidea avara TaxID=196820 RepID=UPI00331E793C